MEYHVSDLLDGMEDCALPLESRPYASPERIKELTMKKIHTAEGRRPIRRRLGRFAALGLAAALILALAATAYASDWFGLRGILKEDTLGKTTFVDHYGQEAETPEHAGRVSMVQPQAGPEDYMEKVERVRAAMAEWYEVRETLVRETDPVVLALEETGWDGTVTGEDGMLYVCDSETGERKSLDITEEEYAEWYAAHEEMVRSLGYYSVYYVDNAEMAEKLEEITAKYGLRLRKGDATLLWSNEFHPEFADDPRFMSCEALAELVAEELGSGPVLAAPPVDVDKLYYFNTGSFAFNWRLPLSEGKSPYVYGHFTRWDEMIPDTDFTSVIPDVTAVSSRQHTAPDGTELTVCRDDGGRCIFFAYTAKGFFSASMNSEGLTDPEIDAVLDFFTYTNLGK